jgi:hypothetical protein
MTRLLSVETTLPRLRYERNIVTLMVRTAPIPIRAREQAVLALNRILCPKRASTKYLGAR